MNKIRERMEFGRPGRIALSPSITARVTGFIRRSLILMVILALNNPVSLPLLGLLNRIFGRPIHPLFICYPATPKYREQYCFRFMLPLIRRYPVVVGAFHQGGRIGLVGNISAVEREFTEPGFYSRFQRYTRFIQGVLGVREVTYSGILPNSMRRAGYLSDTDADHRCQLVAGVVTAAEAGVRARQTLNSDTPVIVLGGKGAVGSVVVSRLREDLRETHCVDAGDNFPDHLGGREVILINVARKGALLPLIDRLWKGVILLNETYPEPRPQTVRPLKAQGIDVYHISGVKARALPPFPHAYCGGIPYCVMNPDAGSSR